MCGIFLIEHFTSFSEEKKKLIKEKKPWNKIIHRGPDRTLTQEVHQHFWAFHRLALQGLGPSGDQPFGYENLFFSSSPLSVQEKKILRPQNLSSLEQEKLTWLMTNGEIYNHLEWRQKIELVINQSIHSNSQNILSWPSGSDCEVLVPSLQLMMKEQQLDMQSLSLEKLQLGLMNLIPQWDGEFASLISFPQIHQNEQQLSLIIARDPLGVRPLFYGIDSDGKRWWASETKALKDFCSTIKSFPPGHFAVILNDGEMHLTDYVQWAKRFSYPSNSVAWVSDIDKACQNIRESLISAVLKRLESDAPLGMLLSGGLDSSLVCAIAHHYSINEAFKGKKCKTFAIGLDHGAIDLKYAKMVADFLGTDHQEVIFTLSEVRSTLVELITMLETWDVTTIRASMGMYLLTKWIRKNTNLKGLLTGEVSDELFGYKYTDFAPDAREFQQESIKRLEELHVYDILRADRSLAAMSFEARVPFSDLAFIEASLIISPELKMNKWNMGKYLLRKAFEKDEILPPEILWRQKAAFSDAVGHSLVDELKLMAEEYYQQHHSSLGEFSPEKMKKSYSHAPPLTKEGLMYREIFDSLYPGQADLIPSLWLPNQSWPGCQVTDPSARLLSNYGASGV